MLADAVQRLTGGGGDPVVRLQTNFGGGKTHSMLALYHLCSENVTPSELPGVDALMRDAGVSKLPKVNRVVLVGNRISSGNPVTKPDGTVVRTLWGELAYQLGGAAAYARVAKDDEHATSPGDILRELLVEYGPCLILIDEWVAYARQLHDQSDLPAGSFETQFTFAQALTESAKLAGNCLLVVSLPASDTSASPHTQSDDIEVGGQRGREALARLRKLKSDNLELLERNNALQDQVRDAEGSAGSRLLKLQNLRADLKRSDEQVVSLRADVAALKQDVATERRGGEAAEHRAVTFEGERDQARTALQELKAWCTDLAAPYIDLYRPDSCGNTR